jgi:endonuclease/exonuclease/phosphatase family metal-dependent hydrolase
VTSPSAQHLRVATYNIHSWEGADNTADPQRILRVIAALNADIIALQEVVSPNAAGVPCSLTDLAQELGYHAIFGQTMLRPDTRYGNALLSRQKPQIVRHHSLAIHRREPRGAIEATFTFASTVRIFATHFGLSARERRVQFAKLHTLFQRGAPEVNILLGDLNDWFPLSPLRRRLRLAFGHAPAPHTFPARCPLFALDRIHVTPAGRLRHLARHNTPEAKHASDHLPLVADIQVGESSEG